MCKDSFFSASSPALVIFVLVCFFVFLNMTILVQTVKNQSVVWEALVQSLGREDPLEKEMATHSSLLAWRMPWTEEPGGLQSMGPQRVGHDWATNTFTFVLRGVGSYLTEVLICISLLIFLSFLAMCMTSLEFSLFSRPHPPKVRDLRLVDRSAH